MCHYTIGEFAEILGGQLSLGTMPPLAGEATPVGRLVSDTRQLEPGDVFWALAGPNYDGADFAQEAFVRGASGVVVAGRQVEPWAGRWTLKVDDTRWALWQLGERIREDFAGTVIGVTGSVGKTTTRQMIHTVLGSRLSGSASPRNYNNYLGVPLTMAQWNPLDEYAVVELGTSGPGEIAPLAGLSQPEIGVITGIGEAHLGGFGSQEAIAEEKTELLTALPKHGHAILNDDPWLRRMARRTKANVTWIGESDACDLRANNVVSRNGLLSFSVESQRFCVPVWGRHHLTAALAGIAVGRLLGVSLAEAADALSDYKPAPQRSRVLGVRGMTVVDDTYNASPTAMRAALELLQEIDTTGRRIVVCGEMCDLGADAEHWYCTVGEQTVQIAGADLLIACGEHAQHVVLGALRAGMPVAAALACREPLDALAVLQRQARWGDVLLFKAARTMKMERLVEAFIADRHLAAAA